MTRPAFSHDVADRLLPWYANETLDEVERQGVHGHLGQCAECRESLALLVQMKEAVNDQQTVAMVPEPRPDELLARIDHHENGQAAISTAKPWLIAASFAILAVAAILLVAGRIDSQTEPQFSTATSAGEPGQVGYIVEIGFVSGTSVTVRDDLISSMGATVLDTLDANTFQVVIPMESVSIAEIDAITGDLLRRSEVAEVNVMALQIPVQQDE